MSDKEKIRELADKFRQNPEINVEQVLSQMARYKNWQFAEIVGQVKGCRFLEGTVVWCCNAIIKKLKSITKGE